MSVLQQVLNDARRLATRLRDHETTTDTLLSQAQGMFRQVESMKEYCEEMNELNKTPNNKRSALIHSIQQENKHIRELQQENKELRMALEEHQNVMELIMSKYRQQVSKLISINNSSSQEHSAVDQKKLAAQTERINEMVAIMRKAAQLDEDESARQQKIITALATENKGLRELLQIAVKNGSVDGPPSKSDMCVQTEDDVPCEQSLPSTSTS